MQIQETKDPIRKLKNWIAQNTMCIGLSVESAVVISSLYKFKRERLENLKSRMNGIHEIYNIEWSHW